ncbi:unnamed protein product [Lampetra planeri]
MNFTLKRLVTSILALLLFASLLHRGFESLNKRAQGPLQVTKCCGQTCLLRTEPFTPALRANILIVSAFWDNRKRPNVVRILAIVNRKRRYALRCKFCSSKSFIHYGTPAKVYVHNDHFNFPWALADIICLPVYYKEHYAPDFVGLQHNKYTFPLIPIENTRIRLSKELSFTHDFGVCISTLFGGYNNVLQFTQAMEMYRLLGAGRVTIYNSSCGAELGRVLAHYAATGLLEVIPWPIDRHLTPSTGWTYPTHPGDVHYYGQTAALNDCLYRHMYDTRYLVMNDVDEIIIPVDCADWRCLLKRLNRLYQADIYMVDNHVFPYTATDDFGKMFDKWKFIPGHNILTQVRREPNIPGIFNPNKLIVNPRKVIWTSVHSTERAIGKTVRVPGRIAKMHHYRTPEQPRLPKKGLIFDAKMWHYYSALIDNVNTVLYETGFLT